MKKITTILLVLCVALSVIAFGCASSGGGGGAILGDGIPAVGIWEAIDDSADGGVSTVTMNELEIGGIPAFNFKGSVPREGTGIAWPWVNFEFTPEEDNVAAFKNAKAVSFMVKGNGAEYAVRYHVDSVTDWAWHSYSFTAPGEPTKIEVPLKYFMQPSWGVFKRLDTSRFFMLSVTPVGYNIDYDVTVWDLQVIQ